MEVVELDVEDMAQISALGLEVTSAKVILSEWIMDKIRGGHPNDSMYLPRALEVVADWEYQGRSPLHLDERRIERYKRVDGIWFIAVVALSRQDNPNSDNEVITFHRISASKVESRLRKGRIRAREMTPGWTGATSISPTD